MVTSGSLADIIDSTLTRSARDVGLIPALGAIFPIFITPMRLITIIIIQYKLRSVVEPTVCIYV